jgi:tetratricopeptide (TPR) repeat protein/transcriptional regulator with XRE-family HTH domain
MKQSMRTPQISTSASRLPNERLKAQRLKKNWTQVYVATQIGANDSEVSRWETGSAVPSLYFREKLCTLFRMTPEELGIASSLEESTQAGEVSSPLWHVPYRRNPFFTGREERLTHLHAQFQAEHGGTPAIQALSGLGGIGKTQFALEYAYRYRHEYTAVIWVQADTAERLQSELAALASLLQLPEHRAQDQEQAVRAVKRWFAEHTNWLLILDNVEDIPLVSTTIPAGSGHVLLTTRAQASGACAQHVNLETMSLDEGMLFLLRRAKMLGGGTPLEQADGMLQEQARAIVRELDGLPLALDQAGAYIEETGCSLAGYLDRYQARRADVLNRRGRLSIDHPHSAGTTLALSYEQVERANKAAAELLRFCAFLDPDGIPEELITEGAAFLGPLLGPVAADQLACDEAVAVLRSYSLLQRHAASSSLTTHRLVQVVLKDRMDADTRREWAERALRAVHRVFPREGAIDTWPLCQRYLSHAQHCIQSIEQEHLYVPEAVELLTRTGSYLKDRARYSEAEQMLQEARQLQERLPHPAYQSLAETLHSLGQLYFEQGRYSLTETCWQEALALQEKHLPTHVQERAKTLNHLGTLYLERGNTREAEPLFQQALLLDEQMEPGHPVGIHSLISQGWCYMQQGRYQEAEALLQHVLALLEQGSPQHLFMIHNVHLLGRLYTLQGYYQKAEECFQRGLALWEQLEFPHPCTARIFNGLASLCIRQGKHSEAEVYYRRAITFWEQLHFQYPLVSESLYSLALLLIERGSDAEAEPLLQRALHIREHWLGKTHPETLATAASYQDLLVRRDARGCGRLPLEARQRIL